jgi:hypothetical protein
MKESCFENEYVAYWIEKNILNIFYKPGLIINMAVANQIVLDRLKISNGVTRPILTDARHFVSIDNLSLKYLKSREASRYVSAGAFLIDNYIHRLVGNIFLNIDKPLIPAKLFTDKEKALQWLEQFKFIN